MCFRLAFVAMLGVPLVVVLIARAREKNLRITVPATALAQAIRRPRTQVRLARLIRQTTTHLVPLDGARATAVGLLLAASRTTDITDAHVVICARNEGQPIVTSDPDDLHLLNPDATLVVV
jgi:predicted nucleic acid-binding protein